MMLRFLLMILYLMLVQYQCARADDIGKNVYPSRLEFYYGNALFGHSKIKLESGSLNFEDHNDPSKVRRKIRVPSRQDWASFRKELDKLQVWTWNKDYMNMETTDGTQWGLKITYQDRSIETYGSNAFPLASGQSNSSPMISEHFQKLLNAISALADQTIR